MRAPLDRIDVVAIATTISGASVSQAVAATPEPHRLVRFLDQPVITFPLETVTAFLTPADVIAIAGALVLFVRFFAWIIAPLVRRWKGCRHD